jgi:capsular polysaccharide biosynthesis protein
MALEERRYRVTAEYKSIYQIVVEATNPEEAEYFANDIDLSKWKFIDGEYEIVDVSKDYFLKKVKED